MKKKDCVFLNFFKKLMKNHQGFLEFILEVHKFNLRFKKTGRVEVFLSLKSVEKQEFWLILCRFFKKS